MDLCNPAILKRFFKKTSVEDLSSDNEFFLSVLSTFTFDTEEYSQGLGTR